MPNKYNKNQTNITSVASAWSLRIKNANKYYQQWSNEYKCTTLEDYYKGKQWKGKIDLITGRRPYTLNLVYATIRRKLANMVFTHPEYLIDPRPGSMDWNQDFAVQSAGLKQDAINTIIQNPRMGFVDTIKRACLDSFFRFSVIEVGYSANIMNPMWDSEDAKANEEIIEGERIYTKWVPARRFRVSMSDDVNLRNCNWCGYYEWIPKEVLQETKGLDLPKNFESTYYSVDLADQSMYFDLQGEDKASISKEVLDAFEKSTLCKVWHIADNVNDKMLLLLDGDFHELYSKNLERIPFITYRTDTYLEGWYPVPPVWHWLSSQDEINEAREQMRRYRRRFNRKFEVTKGAFDPDEIDKFTADEDGTLIISKRPSPDGGPNIKSISNPEIGPTITDSLIVSKDDWNIVTGNAIARGRPSDRQTATATKKQAADETIVEDAEQTDFSTFIAEVGREILLSAGENLSEGMWIKYTTDPGLQQDIMTEIQNHAPIFKYIRSQDIADGYDFDIRLNVIDATPDQQQQQETAFVKFLSLTTQFPQIALSPTLIRETAYRVGYRNEKVIKEMQKMALLAMAEKASMANQSLAQQGMNLAPNAGAPASNFAKGVAQQNMPNSTDEIQAQMMQQG